MNDRTREHLDRNILTLIETYNYNVKNDKRDDFDNGENIGIRRTFRLLGFDIKFADDKTIAEVRLPEYMRFQ